MGGPEPSGSPPFRAAGEPSPEVEVGQVSEDSRSETWVVSFDHEDDRRLTSEQLRTAFRCGQVDGDTLVWREGLVDWIPLRRLPDFAAAVVAAEGTEVTPVPASAPEPSPPSAPATSPPSAPGMVCSEPGRPEFEPPRLARQPLLDPDALAGLFDVGADAVSLSSGTLLSGHEKLRLVRPRPPRPLRPAAPRPPVLENELYPIDVDLTLEETPSDTPESATVQASSPPETPSQPPPYREAAAGNRNGPLGESQRWVGESRPGAVKASVGRPETYRRWAAIAVLGIAGLLGLGALLKSASAPDGEDLPQVPASVVPEMPTRPPAAASASHSPSSRGSAIALTRVEELPLRGEADSPFSRGSAIARAVKPRGPGRSSALTVPQRTPEDEAPAGAETSPPETQAFPSEPFDTAAAAAALEAAASAASGCRKADDPTGTATVIVTFAPSGRVTNATVNGKPFAGTLTGGCIAAAMRRATVPPFVGSSVTVSKRVPIH
jgi:hypothetical protein